MADSDPPNRSDDAANIERMEQLVFASRDLIAPSDQLRPKTLEAARTRFGQRQQARQLAMIVSLVMVVWAVSFPAGQLIQDWHKRLVAPLPDELLRSADQYAAENPRQAAWGMVSVFTSLRTLNTSKQTTDGVPASNNASRDE